MAEETEHIAFANRTQRTIKHLLADHEAHAPWIATAAFYKALHVVEAVFANDRQIGHSSDHRSREEILKRNRRFEKICKHYLPLSRIATVARYLPETGCFDTYLPPDRLIAVVLKHHLAQVELSARRFLGKAEVLLGVDTAFT